MLQDLCIVFANQLVRKNKQTYVKTWVKNGDNDIEWEIKLPLLLKHKFSYDFEPLKENYNSIIDYYKSNIDFEEVDVLVECCMVEYGIYTDCRATAIVKDNVIIDGLYTCRKSTGYLKKIYRHTCKKSIGYLKKIYRYTRRKSTP